MPRKNTIVPIESFDPRLKDLLIQGATQRVEIPCETQHQRTALRNQLFDYRARAREQKLEGAAQLYRAKVSFASTEEHPYLLIIAPRGSEFDSILSRAKVMGAQAPTSPVADPLSDLPVENDK